MDGVGEWATTSVAIGRGNDLEMTREIHFPHSLGLLYSAFTYYTGFKVNSGKYKVMGLAPYGEPKYALAILDYLINLKLDGTFRLNLDCFDYCTGLTMTNAKFDALFDGWRPTTRAGIDDLFLLAEDMPAVYDDALDFTALALDQFKERADRDGTAMVILSTHYMRTQGNLGFDRLTALAESRRIPVIDQYDYILSQGADPWNDVRWAHDGHWNAAGHQWAAEALLQYLKENQGICMMRKISAPPPPPPSWLTATSRSRPANAASDGVAEPETVLTESDEGVTEDNRSKVAPNA